MLQLLAEGSLAEQRFNDAAFYTWCLANEYMTLASSEQQPQRQQAPSQSQGAHTHLEQFRDAYELAEVYYAYHMVHAYIESPFTFQLQPVALFHVSRYLVNKLNKRGDLKGISRAYVMYALAKKSIELKAFKMARWAFQQLQSLRSPAEWQDELDLAAIALWSKPTTDADELLPSCHRCSTANALCNTDAKGDACHSCLHDFVRSFCQFDQLPLVEFTVSDVSDVEAWRIIQDEAMGTGAAANANANANSNAPRRQQNWTETRTDSGQTLRLDGDEVDEEFASVGGGGGTAGGNSDPFARHLLTSNYSSGQPGVYRPLVVDSTVLRALNKNDVFVRKWPAGRWQFYRSMVSEVVVVQCASCNHFFNEEDYEYAALQAKTCPFCRAAGGLSG
eukprot:gnl/Hemi2/1338_TR471_c1_g1_i1.p1 gnl/Hemi2/1338_TR471_c1_g1~~gnl/Hemi2/1338_TR471_c1_g1_i1.p1  ORF type:complete len:447 (-),score=124.51 gnl/Hemi2/1338_TR471_c1_g1_i1:224-1396(-)